MTRDRARSWTCSRTIPLLVCTLVLACGTERPPPSTDPTDEGTTERDTTKNEPDAGTTTTATSSSAVETVAPNECVIPEFEVDAEAVPFERLSATVLDEEGTPIADTVAQACGLNVCLQAKTDSQGRVTISENEEISKLAFKYGDGLHYAQVVVPLPDGPRHELGEQPTLRLPDGDAQNRLSAGASLSSSDAELDLSEDVSIKIDRLSYPDESEHVFVAREFEEDLLPQSIAALDFSAVWVFGPQKTEFCPPAKLSVPNTADLKAGSGVELYILVTGTEGHFAPYAEWGKVGTATVSEDGSRIETDPDSGIPELGIIGLRSTVASADAE